MSNQLDNFKTEFKALLEKYGATVGCNIEGDTHGLSYDMSVDFGIEDKWKDYKLCDGSCIEADDLE